MASNSYFSIVYHSLDECR